MTEPRYVGRTAAADAVTRRWADLSESVGEREPYFGRTFTTKIFRLEGESLSLTTLDDDFHQMRIAMRVAPDGAIVEAVGAMNRHPYDTCPRAVESLGSLVGANVFALRTTERLSDRIPRSEGCLHLADMLSIALRSFRIAKGHEVPHGGEEGRRQLLDLLPALRDTCVSYAAVE
jgi:hypothetical protein